MKGVIASIIGAIVLIGGAVFLAGNPGPEPQAQPVIEEGGMSVDSQVVQIEAKGGYRPRTVSAQAGVPTTIKVITRGTFDCSSALTIPQLGYRKNLPASGVTEIQVPPQPAGSTIEGVCQMGMYSFAINFK